MPRKKTQQPWWKRKGKLGSTLVDILVAAGIIVILGGVVIYAVRPRSAVLIGWDSRRTSQESTLASATQNYQFDVQSFPHQNEIPEGEANAIPICRQGVAHGSDGCISLDDILDSYIESIPLDPVETCENYSGFAVYTKVNGRYIGIKAVHRGKLPGAETAGCLPSGGSSSSASSASSSSSAEASSSSSESSSSSSEESGPSWETFDPGANDLGTDPDGYADMAFDGRYIYFSPDDNGTAPHGEMMRFDTQGSFTDTASWVTYDPGANGVGTDPDGFEGPVYDGARYVYFSMFHNGTSPNAEILRYDTQGSFTTAGSWAAYNPSNYGLGSGTRGFSHAVYDGRYTYFVPLVHSTAYHGTVMRYDSQGAFDTIGSWSKYDPGSSGIGGDPDGFMDAVFDGRYIYFAPYYNGSSFHGAVLRYDIQGNFTTLSSWSQYDPGANGLGVDLDGFAGAVFDGRYVYFVPIFNGTTYSGEFMRYDTQGTFNNIASWQAFDPSSSGLGATARGYIWGAYDGSRYAYFSPYENLAGKHGAVLRFDTQGTFNNVASWELFDPGSNGVGTDPDGYAGVISDGRYVYFSPDHNGTARHGEVLRYDSTRPFAQP